MRILIVGGYGTFGGRLARLLLDESITILIAGRSLDAARRFCAAHRGNAELIAAQFDRSRNVEARLEELAPTLVVDASGPFQVYGHQPYRLIEACIALGVHYLDLADGAQFVAGVRQLDSQAKARGVFVLCGASTCPVLTAGVIRHLLEDGQRLERVVAGIAPSPHAGVGLSVIRAIAAYAGEAIHIRREQRDATADGLCEQRWVTIAPPGAIPLAPRIFSLIEVPDSRVLPELWPDVQEVWVSAAPVPIILHRALIMLAKLRRLRLFPPILPLAPLMHFVIARFSWGEHRGGMFVAIEASDAQGCSISKSWHLTAAGDCGPFIPSMAAEALIRRLLAGEHIEPGARDAVHDVGLQDYERMFARHPIVTGVRTDSSAAATLFERLLADAWTRLPEPLRAMHRLGSGRCATGLASVERGAAMPARVLAAIIGLPKAGHDVALSVRIEPTMASERWTRRFASREFHSEMSAGRGREEGLLIERFGPFSLVMALVWDGTRLAFTIRRWRLGPIVLPLWLAPISNTHESVVDGRFHFNVEISLRFVGLLVRYRGWLVVSDDA